jgi:hypothetical protein
MFLAHFSNTPLPEVLKMTSKRIAYWHGKALKMHNELNKVE